MGGRGSYLRILPSSFCRGAEGEREREKRESVKHPIIYPKFFAPLNVDGDCCEGSRENKNAFSFSGQKNDTKKEGRATTTKKPFSTIPPPPQKKIKTLFPMQQYQYFFVRKVFRAH